MGIAISKWRIYSSKRPIEQVQTVYRRSLQNHRLWISRKTECRHNEWATRVLGAVLRDAGLHGARDSAQTELFPQLRHLESWTDHLRGNYGQVCVQTRQYDRGGPDRCDNRSRIRL